MKRRDFILACLSLLALSLSAAKMGTLTVKSPSMNKEVQVVIVTPDVVSGRQAVEHPMLYLLHGYGGHAKTRIQIKPNSLEIVDKKRIILVCSDGKGSWHWNSPKNLAHRYEAFISLELVSYINRNYKMIANHKGCVTAGLNMGGHGVMWFGTCYKDAFGTTGNTNEGVDVRPPPQNWSMNKQLSEMVSNKKVWDEHTAANRLDKVQNGGLALIVDCGEDDSFPNINKDFHDRLSGRKISHDFITRPDEHDRKYWNNSVDYQILFSNELFAKK